MGRDAVTKRHRIHAPSVQGASWWAAIISPTLAANQSTLRVLYVTTIRYDYTTATLVEGLNAIPGVELRTTTQANYARPAQVLNSQDAIAYGRQADLLILGYNRGVDTNLYWSIENEGAVRVFVDGGDNSELAVSLAHLRRLHVVFKREYYLKDSSAKNLLAVLLKDRVELWEKIRRHPLVPFPSFVSFRNRTAWRDVLRNVAALPLQHKFMPFPFGIEERFRGGVNPRPSWELSCLLTPNNPERRAFVDRLRELGLPNAFIGEIPGQPDDTERLVAIGAVNDRSRREVELGHNRRYYDQVDSSRRCISIPGGGFDTLRFWEILARGSLLVSKRIAIEMPAPLQEGVHYIAFDSFAEFKARIMESYRRPDEADEIRARGHTSALQFHSTRARAVYVLTTLVERGLLRADTRRILV